ncbi:MAG TPA: sugar ABC transporter ATP-binding protein [Polyangiaceae bacterium]|jgi:ribose transport system ATP-binding protein|nr:sugar ABC transporter ATP-binding protein [Polyangiaceae bacterium]
MSDTLLQMRRITKRFPGVVALHGVSLSLHAGEVLALMGENGAGKSTLMKVLGGVNQPDEGEILLDGKVVTLGSVRESKAQGIALIHQELMLAPNLDITSNIFLGNEQSALLKPLNRLQMNARAAELIERVGLKLPVTTLVSRLTAGQMQMVEIAKALSTNARILIMDEPTSSLASAESEQLFAIIRQLREEGIGIIYISHRMGEVLDLADRITVLRDGQYVGDLLRKEASHDAIVAMMVGRELKNDYFPPKRERGSSENVLEVEGLVVPGAPSPVSFSAKKGEILGFAGLVGAGRTELMEAIFGATPALSGTMRLEGQAFLPKRPREAIDRGVYLAPEDRKQHGLVLPMSVAENTSLPDVGSYAPLGWLDRKTEQRVAQDGVKRMNTKTPSIRQTVGNLSGGNQQKVVLAKWLAMKPKVLILDEPTRGIDVGAKAEIYKQMADLADQGITILMVSSDMEETMGMSDRVVVMHERQLKGVLEQNELSQLAIAGLMTGKTETLSAENAS